MTQKKTVVSDSDAPNAPDLLSWAAEEEQREAEDSQAYDAVIELHNEIERLFRAYENGTLSAERRVRMLALAEFARSVGLAELWSLSDKQEATEWAYWRKTFTETLERRIADKVEGQPDRRMTTSD